MDKEVKTITLTGTTYYCVGQNSQSYLFSKTEGGKVAFRLKRGEVNLLKKNTK